MQSQINVDNEIVPNEDEDAHIQSKDQNLIVNKIISNGAQRNIDPIDSDQF